MSGARFVCARLGRENQVLSQTPSTLFLPIGICSRWSGKTYSDSGKGNPPESLFNQ